MKQFTTIWTSLLILLLTTPVFAEHLHKEAYYRDKFCTHGETEVYSALYGWRFDCVQDNTVYEVKHAYARDTALGQILRYSKVTDRKLGIVLIIEKKKDWFYHSDLVRTIKHIGLPITVKTISPE